MLVRKYVFGMSKAPKWEECTHDIIILIYIFANAWFCTGYPLFKLKIINICGKLNKNSKDKPSILPKLHLAKYNSTNPLSDLQTSITPFFSHFLNCHNYKIK